MNARSERPSLRTNLRALPAPVWLLYAGTFVNRFGSFVLVFLVLYLRDEGYSATEAGVALSAYGIGSLGAALIGGLLADRLGRRNTIAASMAASAATMVALSQADGLGSIVVLVALAGFASEAYRPASHALLADLTSPALRLTAFAGYRLAINTGFAAGPAAAGFLAERSFTLLFIGDAITSIAFGALALAVLPEGVRTPRGDEERGAALRTIARDGPFLRLLAATGLSALVYMQSQATFPLHVADLGYSTAVYGVLISLNGALIMVFELALTSVTQRYRAQRVMALGYALIGIGFALTGFADIAVLLGATVFVWTLGEILEGPVSPSFTAELAPETMRGRYVGARSFTFALALVLAPSVGTVVYEWRPGAVWAGCGVLGLFAALLIARTPGRDVAPMVGAHPAAEPPAP